MTVRDKGVQTFNSIRENKCDCRHTAESGDEEARAVPGEESVQAAAGDQIRKTVARAIVTESDGEGGPMTGADGKDGSTRQASKE